MAKVPIDLEVTGKGNAPTFLQSVQREMKKIEEAELRAKARAAAMLSMGRQDVLKRIESSTRMTMQLGSLELINKIVNLAKKLPEAIEEMNRNLDVGRTKFEAISDTIVGRTGITNALLSVGDFFGGGDLSGNKAAAKQAYRDAFAERIKKQEEESRKIMKEVMTEGRSANARIADSFITNPVERERMAAQRIMANEFANIEADNVKKSKLGGDDLARFDAAQESRFAAAIAERDAALKRINDEVKRTEQEAERLSANRKLADATEAWVDNLAEWFVQQEQKDASRLAGMNANAQKYIDLAQSVFDVKAYLNQKVLADPSQFSGGVAPGMDSRFLTGAAQSSADRGANDPQYQTAINTEEIKRLMGDVAKKLGDLAQGQIAFVKAAF